MKRNPVSISIGLASFAILLAALVLFFPATASAEYAYTTISYPGAITTSLRGINNAGQIVGSYWDGNASHAFLFSGGRYTLIDYPGAADTYANGINTAGQIVGGYQDASYTTGGFLRSSNGSLSPINVLGSSGTQASGINDKGEIVGTYVNTTGPGHGFLLSGNTFTSIDYPLLGNTWANGINNAGYIVGQWDTSGFIFSGGSFTPLIDVGLPLQGAYTSLRGINNAGQIVGGYIDSGSHQNRGFLYSGGSFIPIGPLEGKGSSTLGINDLGQIVGAFEGGGFLATPAAVPIPTSVLLLASGLVGLIGIRRKKAG